MRLILEGPDNAGKTSLAQQLLAKNVHVKYNHPGGKPDSFEDEVRCINEQLIWLLDHHTILDRVTPISQRVYNPDETADKFRIDKWSSYLAMKPVVVYCRPSTDRLMRFQDFTWRDGETEEHRQKIIRNQHTFIERYDAIMATVPHVLYAFDEPMGDIVRTKLLQAFGGSAEAQAWLFNIQNYRAI